MAHDIDADMLPAPSQHDHLGFIAEIKDPECFWHPPTNQTPLRSGAHDDLLSYARLTLNSTDTLLGAAASVVRSPDFSSEEAQSHLAVATRYAVSIRNQSNAWELRHAAGDAEPRDNAHRADYAAARATAALIAGRVLSFAAHTLEHGQPAEAALRDSASLYFEQALDSGILSPILALDAGTAAVRNAVASGDIQRAAELRRTIAPAVARVAIVHAYELRHAWRLIRGRTSFKDTDRNAALESIRLHP